jgi:hypothetical protein
MAQVTLRDETATGRPLEEFTLPDLPDRFNGLVMPDDAEAELNGYRMRTARRIDWERQADIAEKAFQRNGFGSVQ